MTSVERVKAMCKDRKIAISKLEKELGFSNGYIGQLRKGVFPDDRLRMIADYFGVSVEYLMTGNENEQKRQKSSELNARDERDIAKDLDRIMNKLSSGEDGPGIIIATPHLLTENVFESSTKSWLKHFEIIRE